MASVADLDLEGTGGAIARVPAPSPAPSSPASSWRARRRTLLLTSGLILSSELCERLAYYSLATNLVGRLSSLGLDPGAASSAVTAWQGAAYLVTLLGAWLADAVVGRYWVIFGGSLLYQLGLAGVVAVTAAKGGAAALLGVLSICALGTGGIKASVASFGADQFDLGPGADPREARGLARYFNFFYFSINVGAFLASTVVVWVQEEVSWVLGYSIPAAAFALSFVLFLSGTRVYSRVPPKKGPFSRVFKVLWRALWSRRRAVVPVDPRELWQSDDEEEEAEREKSGGESCCRSAMKAKGGRGASSDSGSDPDSDPKGAPAVSHTDYAVWLDRAAVKDDDAEKEGGEPVAAAKAAATAATGATAGAAAANDARKRPNQKPPPRRRAPVPPSPPSTLSAVEDTKRCLAYLSVCCSLVVFWLVYSNMTTAFVLQGSSGFDRKIGRGKFEVPSASLSAFNTVAILVLVPVYDSVVVPLVRRLRARRAGRLLAEAEEGKEAEEEEGSGDGDKARKTKKRRPPATVGGGVPWDGSPTHLERIGAGLAVSVLSMLAGAAAEAGRSGAAARGLKEPSVFWLAPQYALVGFAEVLASIGALDLAFTDSPVAMRSLLSAASLLSVAVGNFAASGVSAAVERGGGGGSGGGGSSGWLPDKEKGYPGRLIKYYLMLSAVSAANFVFFVGVVARKYEYKRPEAEGRGRWRRK